jgi:hypothetical protein
MYAPAAATRTFDPIIVVAGLVPFVGMLLVTVIGSEYPGHGGRFGAGNLSVQG